MRRATLAALLLLVTAGTAGAQNIAGIPPSFNLIRPQNPSPAPMFMAPQMPMNTGIAPLPPTVNNPQVINNYMMQPVSPVPQSVSWQHETFVPVYNTYLSPKPVQRLTVGAIPDPATTQTRRQPLGW